MKFFIDQHGCAKNQVDGEEISARLEAAGHEYVASGEEADLVIVNSCGFIEPAKRESIDAVIRIKALWPDKKLILAGCLAQRYPDELLSEMKEIDALMGNADLAGIPDLVAGLKTGSRKAFVPAQPEIMAPKYYARTRIFDFPGTAYVKITEGCDNRCTYCAIPLIRGRLRSRPLPDILAECSDLIAKGISEIVLIGQDLGSYGAETKGPGLPKLLAALSAMEGQFWVRVLYIHPDHFPEAILEVMTRDRRILPYFDLPFQHASRRILKEMNRRGSAEEYLALVARIRAALPDSMIRSTFLVGFPGETDEDFALLAAFQRDAALDWLGVFSYSREEGTQAYAMKPRVTKKLAEKRKRLIEEEQEKISPARLQRFIGEEVEVLVEENVEGSELCLGRAWMQAPEVDGLTVLKGVFKPADRVRARIVAVNGIDLEAEPMEPGK
ncbi:MAG: 30S ribosomal protein S12 methylthiotransferase RimO [Spirochaetes bacterium]|nr:30S ribosomal protein S12 methylthiotransferase RimO [Spirochaetota bacterium]